MGLTLSLVKRFLILVYLGRHCGWCMIISIIKIEYRFSRGFFCLPVRPVTIVRQSAAADRRFKKKQLLSFGGADKTPMNPQKVDRIRQIR